MFGCAIFCAAPHGSYMGMVWERVSSAQRRRLVETLSTCGTLSRPEKYVRLGRQISGNLPGSRRHEYGGCAGKGRGETECACAFLRNAILSQERAAEKGALNLIHDACAPQSGSLRLESGGIGLF